MQKKIRILKCHCIYFTFFLILWTKSFKISHCATGTNFHQLDMHLKICHYSLEEGAILHNVLLTIYSFLFYVCAIYSHLKCKHIGYLSIEFPCTLTNRYSTFRKLILFRLPFFCCFICYYSASWTFLHTRMGLLQVNLFQKHLLLHQLTHNMTKDCSWNYHENYKRRTWAEHVLPMFCLCSALVVFMVIPWTIFCHIVG